MSAASDWPGLSSARSLCAILFTEPGNVVELRALGVKGVYGKGVVSGYFNNPEDFIRVAEDLDGKATGIYATVNPVDPALLARACNRVEQGPKWATSDRDILTRRELLIDVDPDRPSGISATDEEQGAAFATLARICEFLDERGFPSPAKGSSGNGGHLRYRIDLPVEDDGLVERVLKALAFLFDSDRVKVDTGVHNPSRICRLYGTMAMKGDDTPDRPHRRSKLFEVPDPIEVVQRELLESVASECPPVPERQSSSSAGTTGPFDIEGFISRNNLVVSLSASWQGGWKWILGECPFNPDHTDDSAFIIQFSSGALSAGCLHNGCSGKSWRDLRVLLEPDHRPREEATTGPELPSSAAGGPEEAEPDVRQAFPLDALPPAVSDYVQAVAESRSVDVSAPATLALAAMGSAIGLSRVAYDDFACWEEIAVIWVALVARSGTRKTAIVDDLFAPHMERQRVFTEQFQAELASYNEEFENWKKREKKNKGLEAEPPPKEPRPSHIYTSDSTQEGLVQILAGSPRGILNLHDELTAFFGGLGRYSGKMESERAFYLSLFRGVQYKKDRRSDPPVLIEKAAAWITGGVQPGILRTCFDEGAFASGLAPRFLLVMPPPQVKQYRRGPSSQQLKEYHELIEGLFGLEMEPYSRSNGEVGYRPQRVLFADDARSLLEEFVPDWSAESLISTQDVEAAMSKLEGYALRFALILRAVREALGHAKCDDPISREDLENGIRIARWFRDEALRVYAELRSDPLQVQQDQLLARAAVIRERFSGAVTVREWRQLNTRRTTKESERELEELVTAGLAKWRPRGPGAKGGRPTRECALVAPPSHELDGPGDEPGCELRGASKSKRDQGGSKGPSAPTEARQAVVDHCDGAEDCAEVVVDEHGSPRPNTPDPNLVGLQVEDFPATRNPQPETRASHTSTDVSSAERVTPQPETLTGSSGDLIPPPPNGAQHPDKAPPRDPVDGLVSELIKQFDGQEVESIETPAIAASPVSPHPHESCGRRAWWRLRPDGPWTCGVCHSPAAPEEEIEVLEPSGDVQDPTGHEGLES